MLVGTLGLKSEVALAKKRAPIPGGVGYDV